VVTDYPKMQRFCIGTVNVDKEDITPTPVMKNIINILALSTLIMFTLTCFTTKRGPVNKPDDPTSEYDTIAAMDAKWEDAYNNCKLEVMEEIISEDLEFYHDQEA